MTPADHIKRGLILLDEAIVALEKGNGLSLTYGDSRRHPHPETRWGIRQLELMSQALRREWEYSWKK